MKQNSHWEASCSTASQEVPYIYGNRGFISVSKQPTRIPHPSDESSPHLSKLILTILFSMSSYRRTCLPNDFFLLYLPIKSACISPLLHTYHIFHPFRPSLLDHLNTYIFSEGTNNIRVFISAPSSRTQYMFVPQSGILGSTHIKNGEE